MAEGKKVRIEHSEKVVQSSQISTGRDFYMGDVHLSKGADFTEITGFDENSIEITIKKG